MDKYTRLLKKLPAPGIGAGYHTGIFGVACAGRDAGLLPAQIEKDIHAHTKTGARPVGESEIEGAVKAAFNRKSVEAKPYTGPRIRPNYLSECLQNGRGATFETLVRLSPTQIDWPDEDSWRALASLYEPDALLFCGDDNTPGKIDHSIRTCEEWLAEFESEGITLQKFIPNPLTGEEAPKKSGDGFTFRGDACIVSHLYAVCESDALSLPDQCALWTTLIEKHWPVAMLTWSGKKSIHTLLRVKCRDASEWQTKIATELFKGFLIPMGMDPSCANPARLTRAPGFWRSDTDTIQRCLYISPECNDRNSLALKQAGVL